MAVSLPAGGHHDLVLELSDRPLDGPPSEPDDAWAATEQSWSDVVPDCADLIAALPHLLGYVPMNDIDALVLGPTNHQTEVPLRAAIRCPLTIDPEHAQRFPALYPSRPRNSPQRCW